MLLKWNKGAEDWSHLPVLLSKICHTYSLGQVNIISKMFLKYDAMLVIILFLFKQFLASPNNTYMNKLLTSISAHNWRLLKNTHNNHVTPSW